MKETSLDAELYCPRCLSMTVHQMIYLNDRISRIECGTCGRAIGIRVDVKYELYNELLNRIMTKPTRITKEYRDNVGLFLRTFPRRLSSKPFRLMKEVKEARKIMAKYSVMDKNR